VKAYKSIDYRKLMKVALRIVVLGGSGFTCQVLADDMSNTSAQQFDNWDSVSDSELDQLRGGFALPNGTNVDFSFDRITSLNGTVVSSSFFQLPENASLFQNGTLNHAPDLTMSGLGSVIQNNVDNQTIRTVTDINIAISNLKGFDLNNGGAVFNNLIMPNMH